MLKRRKHTWIYYYEDYTPEPEPEPETLEDVDLRNTQPTIEINERFATDSSTLQGLILATMAPEILTLTYTRHTEEMAFEDYEWYRYASPSTTVGLHYMNCYWDETHCIRVYYTILADSPEYPTAPEGYNYRMVISSSDDSDEKMVVYSDESFSVGSSSGRLILSRDSSSGCFSCYVWGCTDGGHDWTVISEDVCYYRNLNVTTVATNSGLYVESWTYSHLTTEWLQEG